jgi:hypothetical protein
MKPRRLEGKRAHPSSAHAVVIAVLRALARKGIEMQASGGRCWSGSSAPM